MGINHVAGRDAGKLVLYALSTCPWCRKTKQLLNELGVAYDYLDVDLLSGKERDDVVNEVKKWNTACSFPTLVVNGQKCIIGFDEVNIRQTLKQ